MKYCFRLLYNYMKMDKKNIIIKLTPVEQQVFSTLTTYTKQLHLNTVLRVAGGWVRDKIMGYQSKDIDIALDNMKGEEFVLLLKKQAQIKNEKISSFGVTKLNPDLSKHLETATAKIHNQAIDFVNLRSETYNNQSRIPTIEIGTPLEDALRRDFTINSLFYNINTGEVEDFTERGISDLQNQIIRTPLQPLITFTDDPLRVLRCFRFKSRFNYTIHEDIYKSLENEGVHLALRTKVSKERIGIELSGILKSKHPLTGLWEILKYKFWSIVFQVPKDSDLKDQALIESIPKYSFNMIERGLQSLQKNKLLSYQNLIAKQETQVKEKFQKYTEQQLKLMTNLMFLTVSYRNYKVPEGKKFLNMIDHIVRNQLKYSAKVSKFCVKCGQLVNQLEKLLIDAEMNNLKIKVIKWLRQAEEKWELILHLLFAMRTVENNAQKKILIEPMELRNYIAKEGLQNAYLIESFIDGTFLTKKGKKGPIIRTILENCTIWHILNPAADQQQFLELFEKNSAFFENDKAY